MIELLRKLTDVFSGLNREYFIIGATARDLILLQLASGASTRRTRDLDISIAIPDWDAFEEIERTLVASGFEKDTHMRQRFYYKEYELDLVPYGEVAKDDGYIYWPPEEVVRAIAQADKALCATSEQRKKKMGTAILVCVVKDETAYLTWLGNIRAYSLQNGKYRLLTQNHILSDTNGIYLTRCINGKGQATFFFWLQGTPLSVWFRTLGYIQETN